MIIPAKNSPTTLKIKEDPTGDRVMNTEIYINIEIATTTANPNNRDIMNTHSVGISGGNMSV